MGARAAELPTQLDAMTRRGDLSAAAGKLDDDAMKPRELPSGVRFLGVWTPQYEDMLEPLDEFAREAMLEEESENQEWTLAYTHAFPGGYLEDGVIYLSDDEGNSVISLTIEPLLGLSRHRLAVFGREESC